MKANRFVVLGAAIIIYLCMGSLFIWSILAAQLEKEHPDWSFSSVALIFSLLMFSYALSTVFSGRLQDRIGPRWVITAGGIMMGTGTCLAGWLDSWWGLILCYSILNGMGIGFSYVTLPCVLKWFPSQQRGLASGLVTGTFGSSSLVFAPLAAYLINSTGSAGEALKILGIIYLLAVTMAAQFIDNPPLAQAQPGKELPLMETGYTPGQMLKDRRFYVLALLFCCGGISGLIVLSNSQQLAQYYAGVSGALSVSIVSLLSIPNGLGSLAFGVLSDRTGRRKALGVLFVFCALGLFLLPFTSTYITFLLTASLVVLCYAGMFGIFPSANADYFGTRHLGVNYGLLYVAYGTAALLGPGFAARLADQAGKTVAQAGASAAQINTAITAAYSQAIWMACAACLLAAVMALLFLKNGYNKVE